MPSITSIKKERAERLFRWKQEGVHAASAYEAKEQATRLLTAKLRVERLAREAMSGKLDRKKVAKAYAKATGRTRWATTLKFNFEVAPRKGGCRGLG